MRDEASASVMEEIHDVGIAVHFAFLLDFSALLGYNQGGGSKASRSPFGVFE